MLKRTPEWWRRRSRRAQSEGREGKEGKEGCKSRFARAISKLQIEHASSQQSISRSNSNHKLRQKYVLILYRCCRVLMSLVKSWDVGALYFYQENFGISAYQRPPGPCQARDILIATFCIADDLHRGRKEQLRVRIQTYYSSVKEIVAFSTPSKFHQTRFYNHTGPNELWATSKLLRVILRSGKHTSSPRSKD